jgi:hypothetical protein
MNPDLFIRALRAIAPARRNTAREARNETLAYLIWSRQRDCGWEMTCSELARALDLQTTTVRNVCVGRGWIGRMPTAEPAARSYATLPRDHETLKTMGLTK